MMVNSPAKERHGKHSNKDKMTFFILRLTSTVTWEQGKSDFRKATLTPDHDNAKTARPCESSAWCCYAFIFHLKSSLKSLKHLSQIQ